MTVARKKFSLCPIERTIAVLSGRWKAMILWGLLDSPKRYNQLHETLNGISQRALTQALNELQEDGVITKRENHWQLTDLGKELSHALKNMFTWGEKHNNAFPNR